MTSPELTASLLRTLEERFAARRSSTADEPPAVPDTDPYVRAAAVLHVFDPAELRPFGPSDDITDERRRSTLLAASARAVGFRHAGLRTLLPAVRKSTLWRLSTREEIRAALAANPGRTVTSLQQMFERWLDGGPIELDRMTYGELEDLSQLFAWGIATVPGLPPHALVEEARARRSAVAMFDHLVDRDFVGRGEQLRRLEEHVHGPGRSGPLIVSGIGGAGKTALVGQFLIEQVERRDGSRLPFAYLPFDSETLDVQEPFTVLLAVCAQLCAQADPSDEPLLAGPERSFRATVEGYRDRRGSLQRRASEYPVRAARISCLSETETGLYESFAQLVAAASRPGGAAPGPVLLVFDTFEEVVYRASEDLLGFWLMLQYLLEHLPQLRVVICGRSRPAVPDVLTFRPSSIELGDLDEDDAATLLTRLGVTDPRTARAVARQVGGNPLSIRLAARVAGAEHVGRGGIGGSAEADQLSVHLVGAELVRGRLYRRLLAHIRDEDVRVLAHPGMVLRRVTPVIISDVLAPACDLPGVDAERSEVLFDGLRREQTLVSLEIDGSLRYREDVREPVLELLANDRPAQVRGIHRLAVEHYRTRGEPADRAEELYHRMMLRQPAAELEERWLPGVERFLASAVDELPPAQRRWLAGRMSIELPPEIYTLADVGEWEQLVGHRAVEVVRYRGPEEVLALLGERAERTPESPLFGLEARALLDLDRPGEAALLLDRALAGYPVLGNPGRLAELLWLRAQSAAAAGRPGERLRFLDRATRIAAELPSWLAQVQTLTETLDALDGDDRRVGPDRHALSEALSRLPATEVSDERSLVRLALVRLGPNYPAVVARIAPLVVYDLCYLDHRGLVDLSPAVEPVVTGLAAELPDLRSLAEAGRADRDLSTFMHAIIAELRQRIGTGSGAVVPLTAAVLTVLQAEQTTLSSASLAGIDDYREPWECHVTAEVSS